MSKYNFNLFVFLIIGRIFDLFTTYISEGTDLATEMNFLVRVFNLGWFSLLLSETILIVIAYIFLKHQSELFYFDAEKKVNKSSLSYKKYLMFLYYGREITFLESLFSKVRLKIMINSFIHVFLISTIVFSFLIGINNLLVSLKISNLYTLFDNTFYQNNIVKTANLFVAILTFIKYHYNRYERFINS